jgi:beta-N-acetylhexosaminidase
MNTNFDTKYPVTLSPVIIKQQLRDKVADPNLVVISDDMHMGAIIKNYGFAEAVVLTINAGVDILIFSNNPAAAKGVENFQPDPDLPSKVADIVIRAVRAGNIKPERLEESYRRVMNLKAQIKN